MATDTLSALPTLFRLLGRGMRGQELAYSFNVSDRCPIGCDCYWRARARVDEMSDEDAVAFFHEMKARGYLLVTLVGGEPYVRPGLLEKLTPIMPSNWLVTSGTTPLRHFPRTTHFVSIDGADAETHNAVRRSPKLFERIVHNLTEARAEGEFPAYAHSVLNALNYRQIERILAYWSESGLLDGVLFSTLTPIKGSGDSRLRLAREEREEIVHELVRQKERYGEFLVNTDRMIRLLHPEATETQTPESCGTARLIGSFDASGARIEKCILGEAADCSQCGCVITNP